jgi:hypothetical protein
MTVYDQQVTTYSDTTPHERVINDVIALIDPREVPLIDALGGLDAARSKFKIGLNGYKIEILEDEMEPLTTTANQGTTIATNASSLTVADASVFQPGHIFLIDSEYKWVSAVDTANNTISISAYGGTNATHAATSAIELVGMSRLEGDDADYGPIVDITAPYNYTSIFQAGLNISGTQQVIAQHGISNEYEYQSMKKIPHLMRLIEKQIFHGVRAAGSATTPRGFGGLGTFITDNSVNAGGAIAKADLDDVMEYCYADGGFPDLFVCNPAVGRDVKDLIDTSSFVRIDQKENSIGTAPVQNIRTQYGDLRVLMSRWCPVGKAYVLTSAKVGLYTLRPFAWKELAATGDSKKGEVIGEFSMLVANDKAHGYIYGITS